MATYLRFTDTIEKDIKRGYSFLKTPSMKKAEKLNGLCAFKFDTWIDGSENREMTESEILSAIRKIGENTYYLQASTAVLIDAEYLSSNENGEGSVIRANYIIKKYSL